MSRQQADLLFNQGLQHHRAGNLQQAAQCYADVIALQPAHFRALNNAGLIAWDLGRASRARTLLEAARALAPTDPEILTNLARLQIRAGDLVAAENSLRLALRHGGDAFDLQLELANVLYDTGRLDETRSLLATLLDKQQPQLPVLFKLGVTCMKLGDNERATNYLKQALAVDPANIQVINQLADQSLLTGDLAAAQHYLERSLSTKPGNTRAMALQAVRLNLAGQRDALLGHYRPDVLLRETVLTAPDSFATLQAFHEALLDSVDRYAEMRDESADRATVNGQQSRSISALPGPAMAALNRMISAAVSTMVTLCQHHPQLRFSQSRPQNYRIESWLVRLHDGGYQTPHVHPSGWLSGCYYLQVPAEVGQNGSRAGYLEFGRPEAVYNVTDPLIFGDYRPLPGGLVTFPSYFWHNTLPFSSAEQRICIAFDIRPC